LCFLHDEKKKVTEAKNIIGFGGKEKKSKKNMREEESKEEQEARKSVSFRLIMIF
jgi:hypothetical protein